MQFRTIFFIALIMVIMAMPAFAQNILIPRDTVIPVVLDQPLSSATNRVGDAFTAHCNLTNCGGFPTGTTFLGTVTSVYPATRREPGQIGVGFNQAVIPDGTRIDLNGSLMAINQNTIRTDPVTGQFMGRPDRRNDANKFIAYGAGAGLAIGALSGNNALLGSALGAAAGWLFGALGRQNVVARDVYVPAGTDFGILINDNVRYGSYRGGEYGGRGRPRHDRYPNRGGVQLGAVDIKLAGSQPFYAQNGVLMVPLDEIMRSIQIPYSYGGAGRYNERDMNYGENRTITVNTSNGLVENTLNTRAVYVDGQRRTMSARSRMVDGEIYVPVDFMTIVTGMNVLWQPDTGVLSLR